MKMLAGKTVAVLVEHGYIPEEIRTYQRILGEVLGADVRLVSRLWGEPSRTYVSDCDDVHKPRETLQVSHDLADLDLDRLDALIASAGTTSVRLRYFQPKPGQPIRPTDVRESPAVKLFAKAFTRPRLVKGALCHGLWLLTPVPELLGGRRVICHEVILADVLNAGALYTPSPDGVVVDGDLVTGRSRHEVARFCERIAQQILLRERGHVGEPAEIRPGHGEGLRVGIVLSSFGFWGEELVAPLEELDRAGITCEFATPYGFPPRVISVSMDPDYVDPPLGRKVTTPEMADKVRALLASGRLAKYRRVADLQESTLSGLLLVGGSGPALDMNNCRPLHELIRQCFRAGKLIAAECYAVLTLAYTRNLQDPWRRSILFGRKVTGHPLPFDYTTETGFAGVLSESPFIGPPIPLESIMRDAVGPEGAFLGNLDQEISVVEDLPFITSRSTAESATCGRIFVQRLLERRRIPYGLRLLHPTRTGEGT